MLNHDVDDVHLIQNEWLILNGQEEKNEANEVKASEVRESGSAAPLHDYRGRMTNEVVDGI